MSFTYSNFKTKIYKLLRQSEKYTKTDMVYLTKGSFWLTFGQVISAVAVLFSTIVFANYLPKEIYGNFKFILSILGIIAVFTLPGMGGAVSRDTALGKDKILFKAVKTKIRWGFLAGAVSLGFSLYYFINGNSTLAIAFIIIAAFMPVFNSYSLYQAYLGGKKLFNKFSQYNALTQAISALTIIITILLTNNIFIILLVYLFSFTLLRLFFYTLTIKKYPAKGKSDNDTLKYGKHLSVIEGLKLFTDQIDKILIFHYVGAAQLAVYSIALAPINQIRSFILNIKSLAFPKLSQAKTADIKKFLPGKILRAEIILIPIVLVYIFTIPLLFKFIFPNYQESILFTQILALIIIASPRTLLSASMTAKKQVKHLYQIRIFGPIGRIAIYFSLINLYGLIGLVIGKVVGEFYLALLYSIYFKKMNGSTTESSGASEA